MSTSRHTKKHTAENSPLINNIRSLMKKNGLNEAELSRKTHTPQATIHKILTGKTEDPRASTLKTLSDFFEISIDELLTGKINHTTSTALMKATTIPLISWKECLNATDFISQLSITNWPKWIISEFISKNAYALSTKPSMISRFPKDTIIFIDPDATPKDGDYVIVFYSGTDEATLREFSVDGPTQLLLPINQNNDVTKHDKKTKILGVLVKSSFQY